MPMSRFFMLGYKNSRFCVICAYASFLIVLLLLNIRTVCSRTYSANDVGSPCRNIGPVLIEGIEKAGSGNPKLLHQSKLIAFRKHQPVEEKVREEKQRLKLIDSHESFRYPQKGFYHPLLSPDDKWLIYHKETFLARKSGGTIIGDLASIIWKKIFYSRVGKSEQKSLPLFSPKDRSNIDNVGDYKEWSLNGKILAISAEVNGNASIVLIDFSGPTPRFLESFKAKKSQFRWIDSFLLYIDEYGNLMKKFPNKDPDKIIYFGSSFSAGGGIVSFRAAKDGTLVYQIGTKVFKTHLNDLNSRFMIFEDQALSNFDISEPGQHALIYTINNPQNPNMLMAMLVNLSTGKTLFEIPVPVKRALFSPDGMKLAYIEQAAPPYYPSNIKYRNPHFFVLTISTMQVCDYGFEVNDHFNWTPDGNHIIYSMKCIHPSLGAYENGIFIMRVSDGKQTSKVSSISASDFPSISLSGKYVIWEDWDNSTFFTVENPLGSKAFKKP
ncbi:MAG: hypothetical protein KG012_11845 [Deltaproteobacteria bacterium]|nr:hypothetical protein [Deltaproteobacteria bacterium]